MTPLGYSSQDAPPEGPATTSPPQRGDAAEDPPEAPTRARRVNLRSAGPIIGLLACYVLFSLINHRFATVGNLASIIEGSAVLMVIAVGLTFVILLGGIDLSVEGVTAAAVLTCSMLVANDQNSHNFGWLGIVAAIAIGTVLGLLNGVLHTRLRIPSFIVTLGMWFVGLGVATVITGNVTPTITAKGILSWGVHRWSAMSALSLVAIAVVAFGYLIQRFTKLGRYTFAIGGSEEISRLSGIAMGRYKTLVFAFAGTCYGIAGVMIAVSLHSGNLTASAGYLFSGVAAVVIGGTPLSGGRGGVLHSVVGVLLITVINAGMVMAGVSPLIQKAVEGTIIVAVVVGATWSMRRRVRVVK